MADDEYERPAEALERGGPGSPKALTECPACGGTVENRHRVACSWSKHGYLCTDPFHNRKPSERCGGTGTVKTQPPLLTRDRPCPGCEDCKPSEGCGGTPGRPGRRTATWLMNHDPGGPIQCPGCEDCWIDCPYCGGNRIGNAFPKAGPCDHPCHRKPSERCGAPYPPRSEVRCQKPSGHDGPHGDDEAPGFWSWPQNWQPPELPSDSPTEERWTISLPEPYQPAIEGPLIQVPTEVAPASEVEDWERVAAEQENRAKLQEDRARALQAEVERLREAAEPLIEVIGLFCGARLSETQVKVYEASKPLRAALSPQPEERSK